MTEEKMTNKKFAKENTIFIEACERVGIQPTKRQASKWLNKKGKAFKEGRL